MRRGGGEVRRGSVGFGGGLAAYILTTDGRAGCASVRRERSPPGPVRSFKMKTKYKKQKIHNTEKHNKKKD